VRQAQRDSRHGLLTTPHDALTVDPRPQRRSPFLLALSRQRPGSRRAAAAAGDHTGNLGPQRAARSFTRARTPRLPGKAIPASSSDQPSAPAAPPVPHPPRFRALALFRRRPHQRVEQPVVAGVRKPCMGPIGVKYRVATHLIISHFVTSADCIAARLLPCSAALSGQAPKPRTARRRRGA
jgi:hypothetical protein